MYAYYSAVDNTRVKKGRENCEIARPRENQKCWLPGGELASEGPSFLTLAGATSRYVEGASRAVIEKEEHPGGEKR